MDVDAAIRFAAAFGAALVALHARENSKFLLAERYSRRTKSGRVSAPATENRPPARARRKGVR
jgi:hypothetical protein